MIQHVLAVIDVKKYPTGNVHFVMDKINHVLRVILTTQAATEKPATNNG